MRSHKHFDYPKEKYHRHHIKSFLSKSIFIQIEEPESNIFLFQGEDIMALEMKAGKRRTFRAVFYDEEGNIVDRLETPPVWSTTNPATFKLEPQPGSMRAAVTFLKTGTGSIQVSADVSHTAGVRTPVTATFDLVCVGGEIRSAEIVPEDDETDIGTPPESPPATPPVATTPPGTPPTTPEGPPPSPPTGAPPVVSPPTIGPGTSPTPTSMPPTTPPTTPPAMGQTVVEPEGSNEAQE